MNFNKYIKPVVIVTGFLLFPACEKEVSLHDVDRELPVLIQDYNIPSVAACIVKNGTVVWSEYYGYSNREQELPAGDETIYHIASISKLFILTAVMQLEEQGKIDLDEDISNYLPVLFRHPQFPEVQITTRMLLTHTAGLSWPQSYDGEQGMWNDFDPDQGPSPSEWVPQFLIPAGMNYDADLWKPVRPGTTELYSNIGICVVAYLLEVISGTGYRAYCRDHIFIPLGMNSTSYNYADLDQDKIAIMYNSQDKGTLYFDNRVYAAGGVKTTVNDLSRFAICYLNKGNLDGIRILQESTIDRIFELQNPVTGRCLAWKVYPGEWFGHTGGLLLGASTTLVIHPGIKEAIIIFANSYSGLIAPGGDIYRLVKQKANEFADS